VSILARSVRSDTAPKPRLSWLGLLELSAFWFALSYVLQPLTGTVVPLLVGRFTRPTTLHVFGFSFVADVNSYLAVLDSLGAIVAVIWQPAIGALSDRVRFRIGRRRPFIVVGILGAVSCLYATAFVRSYWTLLIAYVLFQLASNTAQGPYQGMLPDQVPDEQRGQASGFYGALNMIGTIVGFVVVGAILIPRGALFAALHSMALVMLIIGAVVVWRVPDVRTTRPPPGPLGRSLVFAFAIDVRRYRDFAWLMVSRLLFLMAPVGISSFAFNFIRYVFAKDEAQASYYSSLLQAAVVGFAAILAMVAGRLSDRFGKKRLVGLACVVGAIGSVFLVWAPTIPMVLTFGALVGVSLGIFLSVDWAFLSDLIPKAEAGRYLGVSNIATASAGLFARPLLAPLIDLFNTGGGTVGYRWMFGAVTVLYLLALITLKPVREIKVE
jgi:MFS family permease